MKSKHDPFTVLIESDEEGYLIATVTELRGCHTQAKSLDVLMRRVREAIALCLRDSPRPPHRRFVAVQQVEVQCTEKRRTRYRTPSTDVGRLLVDITDVANAL